MSIILLVATVACLFLVVGLAEPLAARLRLPLSVILAGLGVLVGAGATFFLRTELTDALNPVAAAILGLPIRSNVFLYVFLPTLLFQATLGLHLRRMLDDWVPILTLAIVAVIVATATVGAALYWASALPLAACLLVGAIVSTTDPSAVVGVFRSISAPRRLTRIIEGESLLNDAAAIALFGLFLGFVTTNAPDPRIEEALLRFPTLLLGGALVGWAFARIAVRMMAALARFERAQVSISVALPYLAYLVSEQLISVSGVIAVVAAGFVVNLHGAGRLGPESWGRLRDVWELLAHWAGGLIFLLAALLIPRLLGDVRLSDALLITVLTLAATAARAAILYGLLPAFSLARLSPRIGGPYRLVILWGGLRGAVTLALALAVTESVFIADDIKRIVGILATGFTLLTLIVQGTTLRWLIGRLGMDKLSPIDAALSDQVIAVALQTVREEVAKTTSAYGLSRDLVRSEAVAFGERLEAAVGKAEEPSDILDRDRVTLGLIALAGAERDLVLDRMRERSLSARLGQRMLGDADRLIEGARTERRPGYRRAARTALGYDRGFRLAVALHERLGISRPLASRTGDRFEVLLTQRLLMQDLNDFVDAKIRRIHGRRVAELLHEMLEWRAEEVADALEVLRLQYPGYAEELERRFIRRTALRFEEREYAQLFDDGLIGPELHATLRARIAAERGRLERRPRLDPEISKVELVRRLPLFADLDERATRRLSRALNTVHADRGDRLMRRGETASSVTFIASGAVELDTAGVKHRLGPGEMFGQMAILSRRRRYADARAITRCTLLRLDEARFHRLLRTSEVFRAAVEESAAKRGVSLPELGGERPNGAAS